MRSGQIIKVRAYGNEILVRQVIQVKKDIVVICRPDEYNKSHIEGREPIGVGFQLKDVVEEGK